MDVQVMQGASCWTDHVVRASVRIYFSILLVHGSILYHLLCISFRDQAQ